MVIQEVPIEQWQDYSKEFSRQHEGWLITIRRTGQTDEGNEELVATTEQPFRGISAEEREGRFTFTIMTGDIEDHYTHVVQQPTRFVVEQTDQGEDNGLRLETADGEIVDMEFIRAAFPEALDDVSEQEFRF